MDSTKENFLISINKKQLFTWHLVTIVLRENQIKRELQEAVDRQIKNLEKNGIRKVKARLYQTKKRIGLGDLDFKSKLSKDSV